MTSVDRVKKICKTRKIPISKLEKDLGFANGYIGQLRKGVFPDDRLVSIASYLSLSTDYLLYGEEKIHPATVDGSGMNQEYYDLTDENRALVDDLIAKLLKSQSAD